MVGWCPRDNRQVPSLCVHNQILIPRASSERKCFIFYLCKSRICCTVLRHSLVFHFHIYAVKACEEEAEGYNKLNFLALEPGQPEFKSWL